MKRRLAIGCSLLANSKLLILDEPFNGLDPEGIALLRSLIFELKEQYSTSIIISSHSLNEISKLCEKVMIMKNGEIIETKTLMQIQNIEKTYFENTK